MHLLHATASDLMVNQLMRHLLCYCFKPAPQVVSAAAAGHVSVLNEVRHKGGHSAHQGQLLFGAAIVLCPFLPEILLSCSHTPSGTLDSANVGLTKTLLLLRAALQHLVKL